MERVVAVFVGIGDTSAKELVTVKAFIEKVFSNVVGVVYPRILSPPISAYSWERRQYMSNRILALLLNLKREFEGVDLVVGIAGIDAFAPGLNFVFGEALLGGGVSVVYTPRLRFGVSEEQYFERLFKEVLHEIGHAFGLDHCPTPGCVMNFSNSVLEVDAKQAMYCRRCAAKLGEKGLLVSEEYVLDA